jgi:hypothetical protein
MSGYAVAIAGMPSIGALPRGRRGHGLALVVVALVAMAGLEVVRPLVATDRSSSSAPAEATWPAGLREAAAAAISADAYRFAANLDGTWAASTPAQGLRSRFGPAGATVEARSGDWALELSLARIGRPGDLTSVAPAEIVGSGEKVEYRRGDLVEWYRNEARGLEQGFDLATAPGGAGPLVLELDASGLELALSADGTEVMAGGVLRYNGLQANDATGRALPAWLAVDGQALRLLVDDAGATYPLAIDPWFQQAKLIASDAAAADLFGSSVAVSGDTAVVGATYDDSPATDAGSAYVFVRSNGAWTEQAKLTASDVAAGDNFGNRVALSGDTAVVGARADDSPATNAGSAYVFVRSGGTWTEQAKLTASDAAANDQFGVSVAVSGDTAVVGARRDDSPARDAGSAYVFVRSEVTWAEQAKLTASDAAENDELGTSVAVSGDTVVVGADGDETPAGAAAGSAYVFVRSGVTWAEQAKLTASDAAAGDFFGTSVAVSGDTAVVGAYFDDSPASDAGSAYVFVRSGLTWAQQAKLTAADAADGADGDNFGTSVAVSGDTAVVGAPIDDSPATHAGSAYVFVRSGVTWAQQQKLTASDAADSDNFGSSVAVSGDTAVVGSPRDNSPASIAGSAYVFVLPAGSSVWVANSAANTVTRYAATASGNTAPAATISGAATGLNVPVGAVVDGSGRLYVANQTGNSITAYAPGATGNVAPLATISGAATQLAGPRALALDRAGRLYVTNFTNSTVTVYAPGASGDVAPLARIAGAATGLNAPLGVALDATGRIHVANRAAHTVTRYAAGATGNQAPELTITAGLASPQGMAIDAGGTLSVANPANNTVTRYLDGALVATISGGGMSAPVGIALDASGHLAVTNNTGHSITRFSTGGQLINTLAGAATGLSNPVGIAAVPVVTVTTSSPLAGASVGVAYSQALAAAGGTGPYIWALATGSLPAGLSIDAAGVISGTPSARGTFAFSVEVTDSASPAHTTYHALSLRSKEITAPVCVWSRFLGTPKRVDFTVSDAGSGLATIAVPTAVNIVSPVVIPSFSPGTTSTVSFSAVKDNQSLSSQVAVVITDVDGNQSSCT